MLLLVELEEEGLTVDAAAAFDMMAPRGTSLDPALPLLVSIDGLMD
jgi:hypothetical protein